MKYTLQQLRYLVAVADNGSVSAAARSLYVSQPGVSAAVSHLESTFNIQCFVRHHAKGVTLTAAGKSFVAAAKNVLTLAEDLHHRANELNHTNRGRIALGCCPTLRPFLLAQVLELLGTTHPEISLQIHVGDPESLHQWLRDGTIDVGLMYDLNCDSAVYSKHHLTSFHPHALISESHPLADEPSISLDELVNEPLILLDHAHSTDSLASLFQHSQKQPNIKHRVNDFELVRGLVSLGNGYTILNARPDLDQACHGRAVKWIPIKGQTRSVSVVLVSIHRLTSSGRKRALIDACNAVMHRVDPEHCELAS